MSGKPVERVLTITVNQFPMPPTLNQLYTFPRKESSRAIQKSRTYAAYEKAVHKWLLSNQDQVAAIRQFVKDIGYHVIHVDAVFHFLRKHILCKEDKPLRNDTSNRLKALHDVLSRQIVGVDDSYFWSGSFSKLAIESGNEFVNVKFKLRNIADATKEA